MDEVVVGVDRKSRDDTLKIAREFADILWIFDFNDNFSEIRNELIRRSTCDWILISDGHEIWYGIEYLDKLFKILPPTVVAVAFLLELDESEGGVVGNQIRLFKRDPDRIYYDGAVHNRLTIDNSSALATDRIRIEHRRTKKQRKWRRKQRDRMLKQHFEQVLRENPDDLRAHYYLGVFHIAQKQYETGIEYLDYYIEHSQFIEEVYLAMWYKTQALYQLGRIEECRDVAFEMMKLRYNLPLAYGILGELALLQKRWGEAEHWFKNARSWHPPNVSCFFPKKFFTWFPWHKLVEVYSKAGRLYDAYLAGLQTLKYNDFPKQLRGKLTKALQAWEKELRDIVEESAGVPGAGDRQSGNGNAAVGDTETITLSS